MDDLAVRLDLARDLQVVGLHEAAALEDLVEPQWHVRRVAGPLDGERLGRALRIEVPELLADLGEGPVRGRRVFGVVWAVGAASGSAAALSTNTRATARPDEPVPLAEEARSRGIPVCAGSATTGEGLLEALKLATALTLRDLAGRGTRRPVPTTSPPAAEPPLQVQGRRGRGA